MQNISVIEKNEIIYLPINKVRPNPFQPRKIFDQKAMAELTKSIRQYGVMQPINVRFINNTCYELVAGERRLRASKLAGLGTIPAIVVNINDRDSAVLSLVENMQKENLNYIEEAEAMEDIMMDFKYSPNELGHLLGIDLDLVKSKLELLKLNSEIKKQLVKTGITEHQARALLRLDKEEKQLEVVNRVEKYGLNIKRTEELIKGAISSGKVCGLIENSRNRLKKKFTDIRLFTNTVKQAVELMNKSGMSTEYDEEKTKDGYKIVIKVNMS